MIDDYETIDWNKHYNDRIAQLEKKLKQLENAMGLK